MTSYNVTFIEIIGTLCNIALNQIEMQSLFGQLTYPLFLPNK